MSYTSGQFLGENARTRGVLWTSLSALFFCLLFAPFAAAQIDTLKVIVNNTNAVGGVPSTVPIGAFGYDPLTDSIYVAGFAGSDQQLRRIDNVDGAQTVTPLIFATAWNVFTKGGNLNNGNGTPGPSALLFNPLPIPSLGLQSYSNIWVMDGSPIVTTGSPAVNHPELTQRLYRYNLATDTNGDARDEFTSLMTLAQFQSAAGASTVLTNSARQFAWSGDGQSLYFVDTTPAFGGLWKISAAGGAPVKLLSGASELNVEPAVTSAGGIDTIYLRGAGANAGGIDKVTYNGTTASGRLVAVSADTLNNFFELTSGSLTINAMASDADGNIYFTDTGSRKGIYRVDTSGRISKVVSFAERQAAFQVGTTPLNVNALRMQPRTTTFSGPNGSFPITQILYQESSPYSFIAGANVFKPGDFNRDNQVNQQDLQLFQQALTIKGVPASTNNLKFDLNGNNEVSFEDVKILQQFDPFADGDANMDGIVNITDLRALAANWMMSGQVWTGGDFTGEGFVDQADLNIMENNWSPGSLSFNQALNEVSFPEPSFGLLGFLVTAFALRRRG